MLDVWIEVLRRYARAATNVYLDVLQVNFHTTMRYPALYI